MDQCLLSVQMVHAFLKVPVCTKRLRIKDTLVTSADVICFCLGKLQINSAHLIYQNLEYLEIHFHISVNLYSKILSQCLIQKIHAAVCISCIDPCAGISRNCHIKISHKRSKAYGLLIFIKCCKNHGIRTLAGLSFPFVLSDQQNTLYIAGVCLVICFFGLRCICSSWKCSNRAFQKHYCTQTNKAFLPNRGSHFAPHPVKTTVTVLNRILISSPIDHCSMYLVSSSTTSSKSVISLRPLTCHIPVSPGLIASLAL